MADFALQSKCFFKLPLMEPKKTYSDLLRDPRWQKRRLEIMSLDDFHCQNCYSGDETLNVHHLIYVPGKNPWEYPDEHLLTLCERCHFSQKEINIKKCFADGGFTESQVQILAFTLKYISGNYVDSPRARNQALWSICCHLLESNGANLDDFTKKLQEYRNG